MNKRWQGWQWLMSSCILFSSLVFAQTPTFPPGEYLTKGGWGVLEIKPAQQGRQKFNIYAVGGNLHQCMLEGEVQNGKATLVEEIDKSRCDISFTAKGTSITVEMKTPETCRRYCGARAGFEGAYLKPVPGCDTVSITQTRERFKKLYDQKNYAAAERTLAPILRNCKKTLAWWEDGWIRNDLGLTQAKQGNGAACSTTLKPLMEDVARTDEAVCNGDSGRFLPPGDCDTYLPIVRAARVNLNWCAKAKNGQIK